MLLFMAVDPVPLLVPHPDRIDKAKKVKVTLTGRKDDNNCQY
jgi:hypothetical protein